MKFKFSWTHWHAPTPGKMKRLGNALALTFGGSSLPAFMEGNKTAGFILFALGMLGKFLSEFYVTDDTKQPE